MRMTRVLSEVGPRQGPDLRFRTYHGDKECGGLCIYNWCDERGSPRYTEENANFGARSLWFAGDPGGVNFDTDANFPSIVVFARARSALPRPLLDDYSAKVRVFYNL